MGKITNKNEKTCLLARSGFTVIEILIILCIIIILVSIIMVSVNSAKIKAGDNATFTSIKSTAPAAFMCLLNGLSTISLTEPSDASLPVLCFNEAAAVPGYSPWPPIAKNGWSYNNFFWCNLTDSSECPAYNSSTCGGSTSSGNFCYGVEKGGKKIRCTERGCEKSGF